MLESLLFTEAVVALDLNWIFSPVALTHQKLNHAELTAEARL